ncbi:MAG: TetR/AcrR family transcriptional regulator [Bauldia sp.]|nr:TetR/AcrR family transcriptional regulator [Bauldia sp.]
MALIPGIEARRGPESRRAAIIDAASRVFAREGFAGTGIDAIASEAGVSRQTIYNLIGDKERVFAAVVEDTTERANAGLFATLATFPDQPQDLEAELVAFARRLALTCMCDRRAAALYKLVETEGHRYPELFEAWRERGPGRVWSAVSARLTRLARDGFLDLEDPDLAARQLISLVNMDLRGPAMMGQRLGDAEVEAATRAAVRTFLRAYGRR